MKSKIFCFTLHNKIIRLSNKIKPNILKKLTTKSLYLFLYLQYVQKSKNKLR